jgi:hypothetical protein
MKSIIRILPIIILPLILFLSSSLPVAAYNYDGWHWNASTAIYELDAVEDTDFFFPILYAAATWNAAGADFILEWDYESDSYWDTYNYGATGDLALTYTVVNGGYIVRTYTYFNTYYDFSRGGGGGTYDIRTVATHEFGHWLRLEHVTS